MIWYAKYLSVFEKPFQNTPKPVIKEIKKKLELIGNKNPAVSIVLIAHNEETRALSCIWSLVDNITSYPIEIIGVDNRSTDQTQQVFEAVGLKWFYQDKKGPGHARTCGLKHAKGKYHLCIDSDTMYPPHYIQKMTDELRKPGVSGVAALWSFVPDTNHSRIGLKIYEFLRDIHLRLLFFKRPEACVRGMVFGFETETGRKIGFRTNIIRGEDGALALELKQYGKIKLILSRKARAVTSSTTISTDGSLLRSFQSRFVKALKEFEKYFTTRTETN